MAHYPYRAPIDAYGNGGFRFADMSHRGSILVMPDGIFGWEVQSPDELTPAILEPILARLAPPAFLLLGTGAVQVFPTLEVRQAFAAARVGLDPMSTGAAARTFNVLLAEGRAVSAALIAVG
ncbi:MAG: MTH938/NDUFAF3 family protein [Hyphomicrobiaceae bacterium]